MVDHSKELIILCAESLEGKVVDEMADNLAQAIRQTGGVVHPVYISRCNWKSVSESEVKKLYKELSELAKIRGWDEQY